MYDNSCKKAFPNRLCRTCTRDKEFTHCCIKHDKQGQTRACDDETCEDYNEDYNSDCTTEATQIHIKRNAAIPFETILKGDATTWNASKQQ